MVAAPRPAARTRICSDNLFSNVSHVVLSEYRSGHTAQVRSMGFIHANKFSELLAWWTLDKATRSRTHASLRLASEQVSSRFRAGFGPASIMDFGLKAPRDTSNTAVCRHRLVIRRIFVGTADCSGRIVRILSPADFTPNRRALLCS